jgi:hypothetical protein
MGIDTGTTLPITQLSGLQINYQDANSCLNPPIVTTIERDKLINNSDPAQPIKDGTIIFNSTTSYQEYYSKDQGGWIHSDEGTGDVVGPPESVVDNIAVFADTTGKTIKDGGVTIEALQTDQKSASNTSLYQLSNLGALQFGSNTNVADTGTILVDSLTPMTFQTQGTGVDSRVCTVINGEEGAGSSSPSALLEINSTTGGLLHARMTTAERDALVNTKNGTVIYNIETSKLTVKQGDWVEFSPPLFPIPASVGINDGEHYPVQIDDVFILGLGVNLITLPILSEATDGKQLIFKQMSAQSNPDAKNEKMTISAQPGDSIDLIHKEIVVGQRGYLQLVGSYLPLGFTKWFITSYSGDIT